MLLRYFADDVTYDVAIPAGSRVAFRSHVQVGSDAFLDDLLLVPWQDRMAPIPGEIVPVLARSGMYGLQLVGMCVNGDGPPDLMVAPEVRAPARSP